MCLTGCPPLVLRAGVSLARREEGSSDSLDCRGSDCLSLGVQKPPGIQSKDLASGLGRLLPAEQALGRSPGESHDASLSLTVCGVYLSSSML